MEKYQDLTEKTIKKNLVFDGRVLHVYNDEVSLPDGNRAMREIVDHQGGVCIGALTEDNELYFVRQFRYAYNEVTLELPAGKLEKGQTPLENGKRELLEETGCIGYSYVSLGALYPSTGYTNEIIHLYACRVKSVGDMRPDEDEFLNVEKIPLEKAVELVLNNMIPDSKSQVLILKLDALLRAGKI